MPETLDPTTDDFASMFEASPGVSQLVEGRVVVATVCGHENDCLVLDVGLKTEGRVPLREFERDENPPSVGGIVEVYLERVENALGDAVLSREKARREEAWDVLETNYADKATVTGVIAGRIKGGFTVDLGGVSAFLPGSQVDIRPIRDVTPLMGEDQPFSILKMDRPRGNIVVSRRAVLEESRAEQRAEIVGGMREGERRRGVVKNITDYGVFVDLGGIDGLLHVTDMSWKRISHPGKLAEVGQELEVQIIRINPETQRISLGMKQLTADPWVNIKEKYPKETKLKGVVTNITEYGAFVELEEGVEGLIHVSEMSWTQKNVQPGKIVSTSEEVEVMILDVDAEKRRISLGLKQVLGNPWELFEQANSVGTTITGKVRSITEFGVFISLGEDIDGMAHINDLDWNKPGEEAIKDYREGQGVSARLLDIDVAAERISLGIKQLTEDPLKAPSLARNKVATCTIAEVTSNGLVVRFGAADGSGQSEGFIRRSELSRDRSEQRLERFAVGEKIDALVMNVDKATRRVAFSIKALEIRNENEAVAQYGSADSGASLGDILGAALAGQQTLSTSAQETESADDTAKPKAKASKTAKAAPPEAKTESADDTAKPKAKASKTAKAAPAKPKTESADDAAKPKAKASKTAKAAPAKPKTESADDIAKPQAKASKTAKAAPPEPKTESADDTAKPKAKASKTAKAAPAKPKTESADDIAKPKAKASKTAKAASPEPKTESTDDTAKPKTKASKTAKAAPSKPKTDSADDTKAKATNAATKTSKTATKKDAAPKAAPKTATASSKKKTPSA